jgi:hypothetical protein
MKGKFSALALCLLGLNFLWAPVYQAHAAIPATGSSVAWTSDTYFNTYSQQSGFSSSDQSPTNTLVWQLFYAKAPLSLPTDGTNRVAWSGYQNGSAEIMSFRVAISSLDNTVGSFTSEYGFSGVYWSSYTAGALKEQGAGTALIIPANRYFMIGTTGITYRAVKTMSSNRSAQIGGLNYFTAINTIYYGANSTGPTSGIPTALGGTASGFTTLTGFTSPISIKFIATGTPTLSPLSTPETPTVSAITSSSASFSLQNYDQGALSYTASLYASNGISLIETRTLTTNQISNGYSWTGLAANTTYKLGLVAVGDPSSSTNSTSSPLLTFTTSKLATSVGITFSNAQATFRTNIVITATITGSSSGKITFSSNGKRIPKCISKSVTSTTVTCSWAAATRGFSFVSAVFTPSSSSEMASSTSSSILIGNRSSLR